MLLSDGIHAPSFKPLGIIAIRCFERGKHRNVARLQLVRCVRRQATQFDVVSEAVYQNLELLVGAEAIADQYAGPAVRSRSGLRIEHQPELVVADFRIGIARLRASKMPSGGRMRSPGATMGCSWPYD